MKVFDNLAFAQAMERVGPAPCDKCEHRAKCATGLACNDFAKYVGVEGVFPNRPTKEAYAACFVDVEHTGRRKSPGRSKTRRCVVCGEEKDRRKDFPRGSLRCHDCRPVEAILAAQARRARYARQMILRGEIQVSI